MVNIVKNTIKDILSKYPVISGFVTGGALLAFSIIHNIDDFIIYGKHFIIYGKPHLGDSIDIIWHISFPITFGFLIGYIGISIIEIRERKKTEETLRENKKRLDFVISSNPAVLYTSKAYGDYGATFISENVKQQMGHNTEDFIKDKNFWADHIHPEDRERILKGLSKIFEIGNHVYEYRFKHKDGSYRWMHDEMNLIKDENNEPKEIIGNWTDITERKEAEESLRDSEQKWGSLTKNTNDTIMIVDNNDIIQYVNKTIPPETPEEVIGKTIYEYVSKEHHDVMRKTLKKVYKTREQHSYEVALDMSVINPIIGTLWFNTKVVPIESNKEIHSVIMIATDITERKKAEAEKEKFILTLGERVKELNGLYGLSKLNEKPHLSLEEIFQGTVDLIPTSWKHPDITCGRLIVNGEEFVTDNYRETNWKQSSDVFVHGERFGTLEVCYLEEKPEIDEGPFLKEERNLIDAITERIGKTIERLRAEQKLKESETHLSNALRIAKLGHWEYDVMENQFTFSDEFYSIFHTSAEKMGGYTMSPERYTKLFVHPDDISVVATENQKAFETTDPNYSRQLEHKIFYADGSIGYIAVRFRIIKNEEGHTIKTFGVNQDITESKKKEEALRESEEKFRTISASAGDAIIMINDEGNVTYWNNAAKKTFEYTKEEIIGRDFKNTIIPKRYYVAFSKELKKSRKTGQSASIGKSLELLAIDRKDEEFFVELTLSSVKLKDKWNSIIIIRDIRERKMMENKLSHAQKMESIGQLAAGIAHEINTLTQYIGDNLIFLSDTLSDIMTLVKKFKKCKELTEKGVSHLKLKQEVGSNLEDVDIEYLSEEIPEAIKQSIEGNLRVSEIVQAMKEFSHPGVEGKTAIDINKAISSTITVARNEWKYVADMKTEFDQDLPIIECLPGEFNQVILNILLNAAHTITENVDDSQEEKGLITVSTKSNEDWAEIRISDNGTGIPENIRSKIFDPFFTTKGVGKGTGQGLAISYDIIVNKHGGMITFESEAGRGTTFIIRLPL